LQIVSSLLYLQAGDIRDDRVAAMFQDSQSRIRSMALIHEKLHETKDLVGVNFAQYVESLIIHLLRSYKVDPARIALEMDIAPISLNIDLAIPCGLIINELISNSLKHAFPHGAKGKIQISLKEDRPAWLSLLVRDSGCGLPANFDFEETTSLGLLLVRRLTKQVNGVIDLDKATGTEYRITFPARDLSKGDANRE
jgi:two-component sensor histidine kinase